MFADIFNRLGINVHIERLGGGYYMFGSKKIYCKIINGKLVVRVGGGYMGIEEFIMQYGQQESEKATMMQDAENKQKGDSNRLAHITSQKVLKRTNTKDLNKEGIKRTLTKNFN